MGCNEIQGVRAKTASTAKITEQSILDSIVLYCIVLYCIVLYCIELFIDHILRHEITDW